MKFFEKNNNETENFKKLRNFPAGFCQKMKVMGWVGLKRYKIEILKQKINKFDFFA